MGKHIAIVGYGSACLIILKMLQDLPRELRQGWRVTVFERREGLGGQWWAKSSNKYSQITADAAIQAARRLSPGPGFNRPAYRVGKKQWLPCKTHC